MRVRRVLAALALVAGVPVLVLGIEVQLARTGPRLDDEDGHRPIRRVVRAGDRQRPKTGGPAKREFSRVPLT